VTTVEKFVPPPRGLGWLTISTRRRRTRLISPRRFCGALSVAHRAASYAVSLVLYRL
jgi:hypothetical protein